MLSADSKRPTTETGDNDGKSTSKNVSTLLLSINSVKTGAWYLIKEQFYLYNKNLSKQDRGISKEKYWFKQENAWNALLKIIGIIGNMVSMAFTIC